MQIGHISHTVWQTSLKDTSSLNEYINKLHERWWYNICLAWKKRYSAMPQPVFKISLQHYLCSSTGLCRKFQEGILFQSLHSTYFYYQKYIIQRNKQLAHRLFWGYRNVSLRNSVTNRPIITCKVSLERWYSEPCYCLFILKILLKFFSLGGST